MREEASYATTNGASTFFQKKKKIRKISTPDRGRPFQANCAGKALSVPNGPCYSDIVHLQPAAENV